MIILFALLLLSSPVSAKENVNIKINGEGAYIVIKLVNSNGKEIKSSGTIHYNVTDQNGNYKWAYKSYNKLHGLKFSSGKYIVRVKFDGDSKYNSAQASKNIVLSYGQSSFDPYNYYDNHNWGLKQDIDDYLEYNYWGEDLYDDPYTYDGEGP